MILYLFATLAVLFIADIWLTNKIISRGGGELNPLMKWSIDKFGAWWPIPKCSVTLFGLIIFALYNILLIGMIFSCLLYACIVAWNIKEYKKC